MPLQLRPFNEGDELTARAARPLFAGSDFDFLSDFQENEPWSHWMLRMDRYRRSFGLPTDRVRAAYLAADVDGQLVGAVSVRFELNDYLAKWGGNIGYGVIPKYRGLGYATLILQDAVALQNAEGVQNILVTVSGENLASIRVIEKCGGTLETILEEDSNSSRRYWFNPKEDATFL